MVSAWGNVDADVRRAHAIEMLRKSCNFSNWPPPFDYTIGRRLTIPSLALSGVDIRSGVPTAT
jgi:hypothetical protein